jgi:phosphoribosylglycinamide formyltransferase-1
VTLALGVLVSGNGSNLQAILDAVAGGALEASVKLVLSNKADAYALERAERAGVPHLVVSHREFASREDFDRALVAALRDAGAEWIVLAGFMRVVTPVFLSAFEHRVINIHPSLLPAFPGAHAQRQAVLYGVKLSGCSVHFVDHGTDTGPIIAQRAVPVHDDDDEDSLGKRILVEEHRLLVEVLSAIAAGGVALVPGAEGARARVTLRAP